MCTLSLRSPVDFEARHIVSIEKTFVKIAKNVSVSQGRGLSQDIGVFTVAGLAVTPQTSEC